MEQVIDLHSHILPGVDDGAQNIEDSLEIVKQLSQAGFHTIVATPHVLEGRDYLTPQEILMGTERLNQAIQEAGINLKIIPGAECYIFPELPRWVKEGKIMTLGDMKKYILVELPMLEVPLYTEKVFFELQVMGITPILAHPERNKELTEQPKRLLEWAKKGILLQLDLRSINGRYGEKVSEFSKLLLESNLIHFIGSDAHRVAKENTYENSLKVLKDIIGDEEYQEVTVDIPQKALVGMTIDIQRHYELAKAKKPQPRNLWRRLFQRI